MKKFTKLGFEVRQTKAGYTVTLKDWSGSYKEHLKTINAVDSWIQNMADNGEQYAEVNARLNEVFRKERREERIRENRYLKAHGYMYW